MKTRHNLMISEKYWQMLCELKRIKGTSVSNIIENAIEKYIDTEKLNPVYFRIMSSVPLCSEEENAELTAVLDKLTEEDLKETYSYDVEI